MVHVGHYGFVKLDEIEAAFPPNAAPIKRLIGEAKESGRFVDLTYGNKMKTVILLRTGKLIGSSIMPKIINERIKEAKSNDSLRTATNIEETD